MSTADRVYEQQNDSALDALYSKVSSLRSVTLDIHDDSERQRSGLLSTTSDQFDNFGSSLSRTSGHLSRTISQGARNHRLTLYIVAGFPLPSDIDYYKALDLDLAKVGRGGWDVDPAALKRVWRLRMAVTHPDRMSGRSEKEQQIGAQQSALINRAYETLMQPLLRAQYLLERHNAPPVGEADSLEDPELLMEVMELREKLEEAQSEQEATSVREENQKFLDAAVEELGKAFGSSPPNLETARKAAVELRYWTNIDKAAREWSPGKRVELQH
ncbi:related to Co-chaperone protein HscB, mitochondrial precursor [Pseudozyma flocculosa]|uniref:Related to Co-chaperone protein HscB, mitochondrial n=1 Tax=Pseudozyma flocculosa TaxID=84751 RepID=A0A5C3F8F4_9BASI|nr:related to Co-chaperone protein HscB, mitochondrial precursor [Pseudozyma flocculosa]